MDVHTEHRCYWFLKGEPHCSSQQGNECVDALKSQRQSDVERSEAPSETLSQDCVISSKLRALRMFLESELRGKERSLKTKMENAHCQLHWCNRNGSAAFSVCCWSGQGMRGSKGIRCVCQSEPVNNKELFYSRCYAIWTAHSLVM